MKKTLVKPLTRDLNLQPLHCSLTSINPNQSCFNYICFHIESLAKFYMNYKKKGKYLINTETWMYIKAISKTELNKSTVILMQVMPLSSPDDCKIYQKLYRYYLVGHTENCEKFLFLWVMFWSIQLCAIMRWKHRTCWPPNWFSVHTTVQLVQLSKNYELCTWITKTVKGKGGALPAAPVVNAWANPLSSLVIMSSSKPTEDT